jgi:hypothetical protein
MLTCATTQSIFIERLINTNMLRELEYSDDAEKGSTDPVFQLMVKCSRYEPCDRWSNNADAFKYAVAHPDILRTVAFTHFGASLSWEVKSVELDIPESDHDEEENDGFDCDEEMMMPRSGGRVIYSEQSWRAESSNVSTAAAGVSRFGHTAADPTRRVTACDHGVVQMQSDSALTLHCGDVAVQFKVRIRGDEVTWVQIESSCSNSSKLVPLCAVAYELTEQNSAAWSAAIAEHSVDSGASYAMKWDNCSTSQFTAAFDDDVNNDMTFVADTGPARVAPLVHNEFCAVRSWRIKGDVTLEQADKRIGIALYERPCFDIMGFDTEPVCRTTLTL